MRILKDGWGYLCVDTADSEWSDMSIYLDALYYFTNFPERRATVEGSCQYRTFDGRKCAVGRFIEDDEYSPELEGKVVSSSRSIFPSVVRQYYRGFAYAQSLHDSVLCRVTSVEELVDSKLWRDVEYQLHDLTRKYN